MDVKGKTVLVTGGSSGIGAAVARAAARAGAKAVLLARDVKALASVVADIEQLRGTARWYPVDLADAGAAAEVCERIAREVGVPDVIVNAAGAGRWLCLDETAPAEAVQMMAVPYFAAVFVTRAFLPTMLERGSGTIVNVTSLAAFMPWPGATAYTAARWAMRGLTEALRADLHETPVHVMLATFAKVASPYWQHNPGAADRVPGAQAMIPVLTSDQAGEAIVRGLRRDRSRVTSPWMLSVVLALNYLFPPISRWIVHRTGYHRRRPPRVSALS
jgi:uncharacterized protein